MATQGIGSPSVREWQLSQSPPFASGGTRVSERANALQLRAVHKKAPGAQLRTTPGGEERGNHPREFPFASASPTLPATIREEILDFYAFLFCQRGFRQLGLTFEQFLLVVASLRPDDLQE